MLPLTAGSCSCLSPSTTASYSRCLLSATKVLRPPVAAPAAAAALILQRHPQRTGGGSRSTAAAQPPLQVTLAQWWGRMTLSRCGAGRQP
jgi:hypothetical protein